MQESLFSAQWYRVSELKAKLRSTVVTHRHYYRGAIWYVVTSTSNKQHLRINASAYYVFSQIDGKRTVNEIWEDCLKVLGDDAPTQEEILSLLGELFSGTYLDFQRESDVDQLFELQYAKQRREAKSRYWNPLFLRFAMYDPDSITAKVSPYFKWAFTPAAFIAWVMLVILSAMTAWFSWSDISYVLGGDLVSPDNLIILWFVFPLMKLVHELAHGVAVKRWGGEVHEFGIALLVLLPVPYVDASQSASFGSKYRRMAVAGAGIVVESTLACLALFVWLLVEPGLLRDVAFNVMLTGSVSSLLFNGNPLLKFDSYYVLSDGIEIPSLAQRSNRYFIYLIQRYLFGLNTPSPMTAIGERKWFLGYGIAATVYRLILTVGICLFVASEYFFIGVGLAIWAAFMQIGLPLIKAVKFILTDSRLSHVRVRAGGMSLLSAGLVLGLLFFVPLPHVTQVRGVVWPVDEAMVRTDTDCLVKSVLHVNGTNVQPNMGLVTCDDSLLKTEVARLRAEQIAARAALHGAKDRVEREMQKGELVTATELLAVAEEKLERTTVSSRTDGTLYIPGSINLVGRYFSQGDLVGYVLNNDNVSVRTMLPQERISVVGEHVERVDLYMMSRRNLKMPTRIMRRNPAASSHLVSRALGVDGGGDLMLHPEDDDGTRLNQAAFDYQLELPSDLADSHVGEAVLVRFDHGTTSAATMVYREIQLLLLRRFNV